MNSQIFQTGSEQKEHRQFQNKMDKLYTYETQHHRSEIKFLKSIFDGLEEPVLTQPIGPTNSKNKMTPMEETLMNKEAK